MTDIQLNLDGGLLSTLVTALLVRIKNISADNHYLGDRNRELAAQCDGYAQLLAACRDLIDRHAASPFSNELVLLREAISVIEGTPTAYHPGNRGGV